MKPSYSFLDSLLIFQNYIVIFKDFNEDFDSISKKALIFSKMVDYILTKIVKINRNNRFQMKTSRYLIHSQLVFQKNLVICNDSMLLTVFTKKKWMFPNMVN